jgi:hypothetical protein
MFHAWFDCNWHLSRTALRLYYAKDSRPRKDVVLKSILVTGSVAAMLLLSSCRKQTTPYETAVHGVPQDPDLRVNPGGYRGRHFSGPFYIPRSSPLADGTTAYNVTYQPGTTVVSREDAMRHLVAIQHDGSYVFDSSASQIARLKPGGVLLLSGLALCTVVDVQKTSRGYLLEVGPAKITDAIKEGRLEGTYKIDFSRMQAGGAGAEGAAEFDVDFSGYNYHVKFSPGKDRIDVQATIKSAGSQGTVAYEGVGYLSNFVSTIKMQIKQGQVSRLDFTNANLTGQVELKWFALAGDSTKPGNMIKITSWPAELLRSALLSKAAYHIPILIGALPFDLRVSLGFSFIPSFTSKDSEVEGSKLIKYSGSGGFSLLDGQTHPVGSFNAEGSVAGQDTRVVAVGPVGFTAATEAPRLELVLGWPPVTSTLAGYLNFIASYGIVTNGMVSPVPCQTNIMAFSVNAGAANASPNTFAIWSSGASSSVSLWHKTLKSAGAGAQMCTS